jgi:hypothetical protein
VKLPRTIRLDPSDSFVFERAAQPGEWAVPGGFMFADADPDALPPKQRTALRSGFLGIASFGWSTLVVVSEASEAEHEAAADMLAREILTRFGAPDLAAARAAAQEEIAFAASLCDHAENTLIAVHREVDAQGALRERFRTLHQREANTGADGLHAFTRAFTIVELDEDDAPAERVDLQALARRGISRP